MLWFIWLQQLPTLCAWRASTNCHRCSYTDAFGCCCCVVAVTLLRLRLEIGRADRLSLQCFAVAAIFAARNAFNWFEKWLATHQLRRTAAHCAELCCKLNGWLARCLLDRPARCTVVSGARRCDQLRHAAWMLQVVIYASENNFALQRKSRDSRQRSTLVWHAVKRCNAA